MLTGSRRFFGLVMALIISLAAPSCRVAPRPDGQPSYVSSWTDTAHTVLRTLSWAVPAARVLLEAVLPAAAQPVVGVALNVVVTAAGSLETALTAYEARGGDRCAAHAAVVGLHTAIVDLADILAQNGFAIGRIFGGVADSVASVVDTLLPSCEADAGWRSVGRETNDALRQIELRAATRGVLLRHDLDDIRPLDGGVR